MIHHLIRGTHMEPSLGICKTCNHLQEQHKYRDGRCNALVTRIGGEPLITCPCIKYEPDIKPVR